MQDAFPCKYQTLNSHLLSLIEEFGGALAISWIWGEKKPQQKAVACLMSEAKCLFRGVIRSPGEFLSQTPQVSLGVLMDQFGIIPSIPAHWALLSALPLSLIISCLAAGIFSQSPSGIWNKVLQRKAWGGFYSNIYSSLSFLLFQELISFIEACIIDFIDFSMILYQSLCFLSRIFDQFTHLCAGTLQTTGLCVFVGTGILGWGYTEPLGWVEMLLCTSDPPGFLCLCL